jgi:hypothetical protein
MNAVQIWSALHDEAAQVPPDQWESHWQALYDRINGQNVISGDDSKRLSIIHALLHDWDCSAEDDHGDGDDALEWRMGLSVGAAERMAESLDNPADDEDE